MLESTPASISLCFQAAVAHSAATERGAELVADSAQAVIDYLVAPSGGALPAGGKGQEFQNPMRKDFNLLGGHNALHQRKSGMLDLYSGNQKQGMTPPHGIAVAHSTLTSCPAQIKASDSCVHTSPRLQKEQGSAQMCGCPEQGMPYQYSLPWS